MSAKKDDAGVAVNDVRGDISRTREDLGATVSALADKADVPGRVADTARRLRNRGQVAAWQADESVRRHPARWSGAAAAAVVGIVAVVVGTLRWRQARQAPKSRARRAWQDITKRLGR
jgi:ElaB/YqjD/DUF883 family membrane-anchored ribosome-binding protein